MTFSREQVLREANAQAALFELTGARAAVTVYRETGDPKAREDILLCIIRAGEFVSKALLGVDDLEPDDPVMPPLFVTPDELAALTDEQRQGR